MAIGKEIRTKIKSVQNTQKITRAMEMVAASKMRKAQERMRMARPYADKLRNVIGHLAHAHPEYKHPFLLGREAKRVGFIVEAHFHHFQRGVPGVNLATARRKESLEIIGNTLLCKNKNRMRLFTCLRHGEIIVLQKRSQSLD